jgi:hypoxia up-regulated 1
MFVGILLSRVAILVFLVLFCTFVTFKVEFERVQGKDDDLSSEATTKTVKRVLFGRMQAYPQKKVMTFNKHTKDFSFEVSYGDMSFLTEQELKYVPLI